jgi:hypothetical protein
MMETKYFTLDNTEKNRLVNIIRVLFGVVCIAVALFWLVFNLRSMQNHGTLWITILFLTGFGFYQIWSGIGKAGRYIEIGRDMVILKKYIFLSPMILPASETEKIELYPLKVIFHLRPGRKILLRFGTVYYESNDKIIREIARYADDNSIPAEVIQEEV